MVLPQESERAHEIAFAGISGTGLSEVRFFESARITELDIWLRHGERENSFAQFLLDQYPSYISRLPERESSRQDLALGFYIHDLGKAFSTKSVSVWHMNRNDIPPDELKRMQKHVFVSAVMMHEYEKKSGFQLPELTRDIVMFHHEKLDGSGPFGLKGEEIPFWVRLSVIIDQLVGRLESRDYHDGNFTIESALAQLYAERGKQYDSEILEDILKIFRTNRHLDIRNDLADVPAWDKLWNEREFQDF